MKETDKRMVEMVKRNAEAISDSQVFVVMHAAELGEEILPVIQMGLAVYLDKPVLILCPESRRETIPKNVHKLAVAIEYFDDSGTKEEQVMQMHAATLRLMHAAGLVR